MSQEELERKAIEELKQEKKVEVTYCAKRDLILTQMMIETYASTLKVEQLISLNCLKNYSIKPMMMRLFVK
jgi:hypothetical protein